MELDCFNLQYDFKNLKVKFFDRDGKLKKKYICLAYMITFPLVQALYQLEIPGQPDPVIRRVHLTSTKQSAGYLVFDPLIQNDTSIVTNHGNVLEFNKFDYNYDIKITSSKSGQIRFMYFNIYQIVASNINDIYGNETVYEIKENEEIVLTITGEYQFFFIYFPEEDFNIDLKISVSKKKSPIFICKRCNKNCTCFETNNKGYIRIRDHVIPVYQNRESLAVLVRYLYPDFAYLRDLFLNATIENSLPVPIPLQLKNKFLIKQTGSTLLTFTVGSVQLVPQNGTDLYLTQDPSNNELVEVTSSSPFDPFSTRRWGINQTAMINKNTENYVYRWPDTYFTVIGSSFQRFSGPNYFGMFYRWGGLWYEAQRITLPNSRDNEITELLFPEGEFRNSNGYDVIYFSAWCNFGLIQFPNNINITVTIRPK